MINVLIPIVEKPEKYIQILSQLSLRRDVMVFVGTTKSNALKYDFNMPNIEVKIFEDGSKKEEILNALQPYLMNGKTVICRRPFSIAEFNSLVSSDASIVFGKKKVKKKINEFFTNIMQMSTSSILGVKTFDGDYSILCFDEDMTQVLSQVENFSYATRVDRWKGVRKEAIDAENNEKDIKIKYENNKKNILFLTLVAILAVVLGVVVTTCVAIFAKVTIIIGLLLACLDIICLVTAFFCLFSLYFNLRVGQKNFDRAKEIFMEDKDEKN